MSSLLEPSRFRPKTCPVPVLPLISTPTPANAPRAVPDVTTARSEFCKNLRVLFLIGNVPFVCGVKFFKTLPLGSTIALAICGTTNFPPFAMAEYITAN